LKDFVRPRILPLVTFSDLDNLLSSESQNATATLCHWPVRDKSLVAPIATAVTGALALSFTSIRVGDCIAKKVFKWADLCAVIAFVSAPPCEDES
jgi:hypothetical protein